MKVQRHPRGARAALTRQPLVAWPLALAAAAAAAVLALPRGAAAQERQTPPPRTAAAAAAPTALPAVVPLQPARPAASATVGAASAPGGVAAAAPAGAPAARAAAAPDVGTALVAGPGGPAERTDRADLERSQIIGNRELPKVLYIVPWKRPLNGNMGGRAVTGVVDEALSPIDREVLRRQVSYELQIRAAVTGAGAPPAPKEP